MALLKFNYTAFLASIEGVSEFTLYKTKREYKNEIELLTKNIDRAQAGSMFFYEGDLRTVSELFLYRQSLKNAVYEIERALASIQKKPLKKDLQ